MKHSLAARRKLLPVLLVACGVILSTMDSSMVNVALPTIMRHFEIGVAEVRLVMIIYLMVITSSLVVFGRLGDQYGSGRLYVAGVTIFGVGASACSLVASFNLLLLARGVQALGASMMMAAGPAILKFTSSRGELGRALGATGLATSIGLMSGPMVSGFLLHLGSWRLIFLFSLPLAFVAILLGLKYLVPMTPEVEPGPRPPFDWAGSMIWVGIVVGCVGLAGIGETFGASTVSKVAVGAVTVTVLIMLLYRVEKKAVSPILPMALVRRRYYWTGVSSSTLSFAGLFIVLILIPFYLDYLLNFSAARVGLAMMALPVSLVVASPLSGWLFDRLGSARKISTCGLLLSCGAILALIALDPDATFFEVCWRLTVLGAGQAIFLSPNSASVLTQVSDRFSGTTSGILATARNFGMLAGTAVAGSGFGYLYQRFSGEESLLTFTPQLTDAFLLAQRATLSVAFLLFLLAAAISWQRG